ncbi:hypothetical protein H2198_009522 [Neophaeococcomyces mojaviensis]|uniref:Uncharacterized protein n=1 Tax=Neophaeococcomyces mojaviensis TaxID=3383035 RepID=A0ACC2ZUT5_9EURO|nr:hypothetical protein H2198_009522 [Knufia sp. JES_112]
MPISHQPWLPNASIIFGGLPILVGLQLMRDPNWGLDLLGFARPAGAEAQKLTESLVMYFGTRDLAFGLSALAAWRSGNRQTLGWIMLVGSGMTVIDGFTSIRQTGGGVWKHWTFTPIGLGLGGGLLGWFD